MSGYIGAEIHGVDLSKPMPESTFTYVRDAWLDHGVLLFRDQHLNHAQHIAFSKLFGELDDHSSIPKFRDPVHHEILRVTNDVVSGRKQTVGRQWHSDLSITLQPARGSILRCEALPPVGGDTMFANTYKAFESLSAPLQHMLENMEATVAMHEGEALYVELPASVELLVAHTDPGLQGDRSTGGTKPATLETGAQIQVPLFISTGEKLKVDTRDGRYLGRAN